MDTPTFKNREALIEWLKKGRAMTPGVRLDWLAAERERHRKQEEKSQI